MKKVILVSLVIGGLSFGTFAQDAQPSNKQRPPHERKAQGGRYTPEERAMIHTKRMQESLTLSKNQYDKVFAINLEQEKKRDEFHASEQAKTQATHEKMQAEHKEMTKKYASVLTPEQLTKLQANEEKRRGEMKNRPKRGGRRN
jgi:protein CpxP